MQEEPASMVFVASIYSLRYQLLWLYPDDDPLETTTPAATAADANDPARTRGEVIFNRR